LPQSLQSELAGLSGKGALDLTFPIKKAPSDPGAYDEQLSKTGLVDTFYQALKTRRDEVVHAEGIEESDNWSIVGVTDHNCAHFSAALSKLAWESKSTNRLIVLPGLELDVSFDVPGATDKCHVHILCLFEACTKASDIRVAINECKDPNTNAWSFGEGIRVSELPDFVGQLRSHSTYPAICVAAHVWSSKGVNKEISKTIFESVDARVARLEGELARATVDGAEAEIRELTESLAAANAQGEQKDETYAKTLRLIGTCGFDALQVRDRSHETHYRRLHRFRQEQGRSVPIICSDAHSPDRVFDCFGEVPYAKVSSQSLAATHPRELFDELRNRVLRFGETRTTYTAPGSVNQWIDGIEITPDSKDARRFWRTGEDVNAGESGSYIFSLSRNLNCLVGGRGSGKSAVVEALAFLTQNDQYPAQAKKRSAPVPDWYSRAKATLSGCRLRAVWKSSGPAGIGSLTKKSLIAARYFDPDGNHKATELKDADGKAIVDSTISQPAVRLLRVNDIENASEPKNLRSLFDELCGPALEALGSRISELRADLQRGREDIVSICNKLEQLTRDGAPLRQYGVRRLQFEAVNKEHLAQRYESIDLAEAVRRSAKGIVGEWKTAAVEAGLEAIASHVDGFLAATVRTSTNSSGETREAHEDLLAITKSTSDDEPKTPAERLKLHLSDAIIAAKELDKIIVGADMQLENTLRNQRDELEKEGLPTGSSDRDAKKIAFDEAKNALGEYVEQTKALNAALKQRREVLDLLVGACRKRTTLREQRSSELTENLRRDLDQNVLRVEVDVLPVAEKSEFETWLKENFDKTFTRYASHRRSALLAADVSPVIVRDILLSPEPASTTELEIDKPAAKDGRINAEDCEKFVAACRGRKSVALDEAESWTKEFAQSLPTEVQSGVCTYPLDSDGIPAIDRVLQLDEVVLDDLAEVRLNDRPTDSASEARPLSVLSPGQRCSAILPILLLSGTDPLVIDQPEENLDNRLIRQVVVNILASMKLHRQVIIATHNPNLPVLGDVEQCVVLQATGRDLSTVVASGSLDAADVSRYVTEIMEGGREAFQYRQAIYQSHWDGPIDDAE
jgi:energy-coupling factor transporter ATP-binding protein EcfA2